MGIQQFFFKFAARTLQQPAARFLRGMTLGTRAAVFDNDCVLLVRHTYAPGWFFPGGGVERGETLVQAALREMREESGILGEEPVLHGIFSNEEIFKGDHVAFYVVRKFTHIAWTPNREIAEARFFPVAKLPSDVTGGTARRLDEIVNGAPVSAIW